jgi:hypothetical protein
MRAAALPSLIHRLLAGALVLSTSVAQAQAQQTTPLPKLSPELEAVRSALDKYRDPVVAVHDGYFSSVGCIDFPKGGTEGTMEYKPGAMGIHFLNMQAVSPTLDPARPQVLIYEPIGDELRLVAAEWFVPLQVAGQARPSIFGRELDGPMEGHKPLMPQGLHHYDLHVWLWKENPAGVFAPTNINVKCPPSRYSFAEQAPKMVAHPKH